MQNVKTQTALAKALGKSQQAICKWIKDDRWPFTRSGPWDPDAVKAWTASTLTTASAPADPSAPLSPQRQVKVKVLIERGKLLELQRLIMSGAYVQRIPAMMRQRQAIRELISSLMYLKNSGIIEQMKSVAPDQAEEMLTGKMKQLADQFEQALTEPLKVL